MKASLIRVVAVSGSMLACWAGAGSAQEAAPTGGARATEARTIYIWTGGAGSVSTVGTWGNGSATASGAGESGLTIRTRNFYEGARFDLNPPIDLEPYRQTGYLRLRLRGIGNSGGGRRGGFPGGGFPGGGSSSSSPSGAGFLGGGGFPGGNGFGAPSAGGFPGGGAPTFQDQMLPRADGMNAEELAIPIVVNGVDPMIETRRSAQFGAATPPMQEPDGGFPQGTNFPPNMTPGMAPGMMMPGQSEAPAAPVTKIQQMQLILVLEKGAMIGRFDVQPSDSQGGRTYAIALNSLQSTPDATGRVRRIVLTGDQDGTFSLDQFALVVETNRMVASIRRAQDAPGTQLDEIEVRPGPITLVADVESGIADASVEWNFDADTSGSLPPPAAPVAAPGMLPNLGGAPTGQPGMMGGMPSGMMGGQPGAPGTLALPAPVGPRIDARGLAGRFEYPNEEQNYRVEITVRDRAGRKPPVKSSIIVKVRSG